MCKYGLLYLVAFAIPVLRVQLRFVNCINKRKKQNVLWKAIGCRSRFWTSVVVRLGGGLRGSAHSASSPLQEIEIPSGYCPGVSDDNLTSVTLVR